MESQNFYRIYCQLTQTSDHWFGYSEKEQNTQLSFSSPLSRPNFCPASSPPRPGSQHPSPSLPVSVPPLSWVRCWAVQEVGVLSAAPCLLVSHCHSLLLAGFPLLFVFLFGASHPWAAVPEGRPHLSLGRPCPQSLRAAPTPLWVTCSPQCPEAHPFHHDTFPAVFPNVSGPCWLLP